MDEDIDIVVNTISIESILSEKALAESESAKQSSEEIEGSKEGKKKKGRKRKASSDEDSLPDLPNVDENKGTENERRRSGRKSRPNNFYRNFDLDSDSDGESKKRPAYMHDDDYQPNVDTDSPKKPKPVKIVKNSFVVASGNISDALSATASRSSLDSSVSTTSSTPILIKTAVKKIENKILLNTPVKISKDRSTPVDPLLTAPPLSAPVKMLKEKSKIAPPLTSLAKISKEESTPVDPLLTPVDILCNVPSSTSVMGIATPDISSGDNLLPDNPKLSPLIISNSADSESFGLGNITNVTSLRDTLNIENGNNSMKLNTMKASVPSKKYAVTTLTKDQSHSACLLVKNLLNKTKGLGFLLNTKAEGLINKKATTDYLKTSINVSFCIDKTLLLVKLAKNNLISLENEIKKNYADFSAQHNLINHLDNGSVRVAAPSKTSSVSTVNDDDSDCEIIEESSPNSPCVDGTKPDGLSLLKRVEKSGVSWKPTSGSSKPKFGSQEIQLPGQHAVWINKSIMVKKVPQAKPKQQSFFWMDGRTLKPPDGECSIAAWRNSKLNAAKECFDVVGTLDRVNSVGWLNLAFNTYNINSLLSSRKMTAKRKRASCSDLGESCSDTENDDESLSTIFSFCHIESQKHNSSRINVNIFVNPTYPGSLREICLMNINSRMALQNITSKDNNTSHIKQFSDHNEPHMSTPIENYKNSKEGNEQNRWTNSNNVRDETTMQIRSDENLVPNILIDSSNLENDDCDNTKSKNFGCGDIISKLCKISTFKSVCDIDCLLPANSEERLDKNISKTIDLNYNNATVSSPANLQHTLKIYENSNNCLENEDKLSDEVKENMSLNEKDDNIIIKNCDELSNEDVTRSNSHLENVHNLEEDNTHQFNTYINKSQHNPETPLKNRHKGKTKRSDDFIPLYKSYSGSVDSSDERSAGSVEKCSVTDDNDNPVIEERQSLYIRNRNALRELLQSSSDSGDSVFIQPIKKKVFVKRCQKRIAENEHKEVNVKSLLALSLDSVKQKLSSHSIQNEGATDVVIKSPKISEEDLLQNEINRLTDLSTLTTSNSNTLQTKITHTQENRVKKMNKLEQEVLYSSESVGSDDSSDDITSPAVEKTDKELEMELQLKSNLAAKHLLAGSSSDSDYLSSGSDSLPKHRKNKDESVKSPKYKLDVKQTADGSEKLEDGEISASRMRDKLLNKTQSMMKKIDNEMDSDEEEANWIHKKKMIEAIHPKHRNRRSTSSKNDSSSAISNYNLFDSDSSEDCFEKKREANSDSKRKSLMSITEESEGPTAGCSKESEIDTSNVSLLKSSSENSDTDNEESGSRPIKEENILTSPTSSVNDLSGKGRKNIRKVINTASLADATKKAAIEEENRLQRLLEKNSQILEYFKNSSETKAADNPGLVLDFDLETKKPLVSVNPKLVPLLKNHQVDGIKFIWDTCFESVKIASESPGGGCILAHCMGLGKTLQVIALIHSVLTSDNLSTRTVLICCPLSTVLNWVDEFRKWLNRIEDTPRIRLYQLSKLKSYSNRAVYLEDWQKNGGVFIMGYEMFRHLININEEKMGVKSSVSVKISNALISPGPDIVVCDEGHLLRNDNTMLAKSMNRISTRRRIVLTGTPLQNNLKEYYCMVNFVKPNLLGTQREYINRFENPIKNGQHKDSSLYDIKIMKKRSHVLHKMLEGCVQRKEVSELYPYLPRKQEYVLLTTLSECQASLYEHYLGNYAKSNQNKKGQSLLKDFHTLQKIWTHPRVLKDFCEKARLNKHGKTKTNQQSFKSSTVTISNDLDDVICLEDDLRDEKVAEETSTFVDDNWWKKNVDKKLFETPYVSNKFSIVFDILDECGKIGDKMLIFCTSLYTLNTLEYFLKKRNGWALGRHYYRLDGSVNLENRQKWCRQFNMENNKLVKLFLISTRAGGLGINMVAANRVIIMDVSWNPSHDVQSIFRVYRFGQKKDCYIYRLVALGTMEEKIYERSVTKQAISCRVVDEQQIDRHYNMGELAELYVFNYPPDGIPPVPNFPSDPILASVLAKHRHKKCAIPTVWSVHEHDSLLKDLHDEQLDEEERKAAWVEYEAEKAHLKNLATNMIPGPRRPLSLMNRTLPAQVRLPLHYAYKKAFPIGPIISNHVNMLNSTNQFELPTVEDSILPDTVSKTYRDSYTNYIHQQYVGQSTIRPIRPPKPAVRHLKVGQPIRKHYKPSPKKAAEENLRKTQRWSPRRVRLGAARLNNIEITDDQGRSCHISPSGKIVKRSPGKPKFIKHNIYRTPKKAALPPIYETGTEAVDNASSSAVMDLTDLPDTPDKKTQSRRSSFDRRSTPDDAYRKRTPSKKTPTASTSHRRTPKKKTSTPKKNSTPKKRSTPSRKKTPNRLSIFRQYTQERLASSAKKLNFTETTPDIIQDEISETFNSEVAAHNEAAQIYTIQLD